MGIAKLKPGEQILTSESIQRRFPRKATRVSWPTTATHPLSRSKRRSSCVPAPGCARCLPNAPLPGPRIVQLGDAADTPADLTGLGRDALLAITIENPGLDPRQPQRYQSLVEPDTRTLDAAFEGYFRNSEQLPTRLLLAADGEQLAGLMLQKLPGDEGDDDGWNRAGLLFDTLGREELLGTASTALLHRLFHEESLTVLDQRALRFGCSCSRERVESMLVSPAGRRPRRPQRPARPKSAASSAGAPTCSARPRSMRCSNPPR